MKEKNQESVNEFFLIEYQAAQDSAQYHDNLIWTTTGIIWGASLVLSGFVMQNINNNALKPYIIAACSLAILQLIFLWTMARQWKSVKNQKYSRCKEIEELFDFKQHSQLKYKKNSMGIFYGIVTASQIVFWGTIVVVVLFL